MAKPDFFLTVDCETTINGFVADFAAVISDRKGNIHNQCAVLVRKYFDDAENNPLFFNNEAGEVWTKERLKVRYEAYNNMLNNGTRIMASVAAINRWLDSAKNQYDPYLTAYNLSFDAGKCANTGIDLTQFADKQFCLWYASFTKWGFSKKYRQFVLNTHAFNSPTEIGNMTFKTNAETMARFVLNNPTLANEPHTALEDILYYELPILNALVKRTNGKTLLETKPYNWRDIQVKDWFMAK